MYKKEILSGIMGLVLGALIGGGIIYVVYVPGFKEANQNLESKVENARSLLAQGEEAYSISGSVKKVEGNIVFVKINEGLFPLDETPEIRKVVVTENTTITSWRYKDPEVYQAELEEYERKVAGLEDQDTGNAEEELLAVEYPMDTEAITLGIEDLKPGDIVAVNSVFVEGENEEEVLGGQEDIKFKEEFEASTISVTPEAEPLEGEFAPEDELGEESETNI